MSQMGNTTSHAFKMQKSAHMHLHAHACMRALTRTKP